MEIQVLELIEGAKKAEGLTVIIDVFRAFSFECYLYFRSASAIIPVGSVDEARKLKHQHPEYLLAGERSGRRCNGFDYGNSPSQIMDADLSGKYVIHTTSAGTQGIVNVNQAEEIITGSLVNAQAVASYIKKKEPSKVSLVAMGKRGIETAKEDVLCAEYLKSILEGKPFDIEKEIQLLRHNGAQHFFDPQMQEVYPEKDFWLCTDINRFPFILKVNKKENGMMECVKINVATGGAQDR